jgi:hypothetical protein
MSRCNVDSTKGLATMSTSLMQGNTIPPEGEAFAQHTTRGEKPPMCAIGYNMSPTPRKRDDSSKLPHPP